MSEPSHPLTAAFMAKDLGGLIDQLAPDVLFRSPIISTPFRGKEEVGRLYEIVLDTFEGVELIEEIEREDRLVATFWLRFGHQPAKSLELVRLTPEGLAQEIEIFVRPMAGLTALAAALAPKLGRVRGRYRGPVLRAASGPLAMATRHADPIASKLVLGRSEKLRAG